MVEGVPIVVVVAVRVVLLSVSVLMLPQFADIGIKEGVVTGAVVITIFRLIDGNNNNIKGELEVVALLLFF